MTARIVRFHREWRYCPDGVTIKTASPGDEISLNPELYEAAIEGEFATAPRGPVETWRFEDEDELVEPEGFRDVPLALVSLETKPVPASPETKPLPKPKAAPKAAPKAKAAPKGAARKG